MTCLMTKTEERRGIHYAYKSENLYASRAALILIIYLIVIPIR